ncbi:hypothetical protein I2750_19845 [Bacillus sp. PR5]|nr:hypothetical protein [Bacillus sp. PR5]
MKILLLSRNAIQQIEQFGFFAGRRLTQISNQLINRCDLLKRRRARKKLMRAGVCCLYRKIVVSYRHRIIPLQKRHKNPVARKRD